MAALREALRQLVGLDPPWSRDLAEFYGVPSRMAERLGQRQKGRRPHLPRGPKGMTYEEVWGSRLRDTPGQQVRFWEDLGSWPVFRQVRRRRYGAWPRLLGDLPEAGTLLEYGCGIAPLTWWLVRRRRDFRAVLVDVPGQALEFALWRLVRLGPGISVRAVMVTDAAPPKLPPSDVAAVLEVLEHVPSPLVAMEAVLSSLRPKGILWEDFFAHAGDGSPADLPSAARERPAVYEMIRRRCRLLSGEPPEAPEGGGTRRWVKR